MTIEKENKIYVYIIEYTIIDLIIIEGECVISTVKITLTALSSKRSIGNDIVFEQYWPGCVDTESTLHQHRTTYRIC